MKGFASASLYARLAGIANKSVGKAADVQHLYLGSLLTMSMYLAQDVRVAQRLFIPGTSA
jgi:hypothetical protein